jgi:hypothetical protein
MTLLGAGLAACVAYALASHPGLVAAVAPGASRSSCPRAFNEPLPAGNGGLLADLRRRAAAALAPATTVYQEGSISAQAQSVDSPPTLLWGARRAAGPGGYELRSRSDELETNAAVFRFSNAAGARLFVQQEASLGCRARASAPRPPAADVPTGIRNVRYTDGWGTIETDVFLARGPYGYALVYIVPQDSGTGADQDAAEADRLACRFPAAGCA